MILKVKTEKLELPVMNEQEMKNSLAKIQGYLEAARQHLEPLKRELYLTLDGGNKDSKIFAIGNVPQPKHSGVGFNATVDYTQKPSFFLERAYTLQTVNEQGMSTDNRYQHYINAGTAFLNSTESNDATVQLFKDASAIITAINSALSQINRIEYWLNRPEQDEQKYEYVILLLPALNGAIEAVLSASSQSQLVEMIPNQTLIQKVLSGLADLVNAIRDFVTEFGLSQEQKYANRFFKIQDKYSETTSDPEPSNDLLPPSY